MNLKQLRIKDSVSLSPSEISIIEKSYDNLLSGAEASYEEFVLRNIPFTMGLESHNEISFYLLAQDDVIVEETSFDSDWNIIPDESTIISAIENYFKTTKGSSFSPTLSEEQFKPIAREIRNKRSQLLKTLTPEEAAKQIAEEYHKYFMVDFDYSVQSINDFWRLLEKYRDYYKFL